MLYKLAADLVVSLHVAYVAFVLLGQLAILVGILCRWGWIRNMWFRSLHLAAILLVVAESLLGIVCPLTTLEDWLRQQAGTAGYRGDFIAHWLHEILFYDAPPWMFTAAYTAFGLLVLATFWIAPPARKRPPEAPPIS